MGTAVHAPLETTRVIWRNALGPSVPCARNAVSVHDPDGNFLGGVEINHGF